MKTASPARWAPAFLDTFAGCIPCKVIRVIDGFAGNPNFEGHSSSCVVTVKLTAARGAYRRGEEIESSALHVIPRKHVKGNRIIGGYRWKPSPQPTAEALNAEFTKAGGRPQYRQWFAEIRGNRLAVFYPPTWSPVQAADELRTLGVSGQYTTASGPVLEFPASFED